MAKPKAKQKQGVFPHPCCLDAAWGRGARSGTMSGGVCGATVCTCVCGYVCMWVYVWVWWRSGSWGLGPALDSCLSGGDLAAPLIHRRPLSCVRGGFVRGLPLRSSGWMRGCPCGGLPGFCAPWGLLVAWVLWPGSSGPLSLLLIALGGRAVALYTHN